MDMTFWYILLLATNLSAGQTNEFHITVKDGDALVQYHIEHITDDIWTIDWPDKQDSTKTKSINFEIEDKVSLRTLILDSPILLEKLCDCKDVDWEKVNLINPHTSLQEQGETGILVDRNSNGFTLSQESGFLNKYEEILVDWERK